MFAVLEAELTKGPVDSRLAGPEMDAGQDQTLIGWRFDKSMALSGILQMLRRHGWSHQVPSRRAVERDEAAVASRVKD
ncbi:winged helix-turn-helix domain-containing protein [Streptomyces sp. NBC_00568]|uniref:helix-turn-helix domain-containing protein n=1 Tax=Streptomyces sp. NBC_00568 TaxID=2975779 RepID=UPI00224FAF15|nr:winged helix-turn-helix domain-containing protein [Streptomyces sp. NBC_00568]MCX4993631.1 winged helix-turn-helix domain-containing protein [Streptomyces sp. NBC_00568]